MRNLRYYISIIVLVIIFGCKTDKTDLHESKKLDAHKTMELMTQILNDESGDYFSSSCISEKPRAISYPMVSDFDEYVRNHLNITDTLHYNRQSRLFREFVLTEDLVPDKKILTQKKFDELEGKSRDEGIKFWDWLYANCKYGYSSISRPIFNENYDLAYVQIANVCGRLCGGGEERIYEFTEGKWILKETLSSWVS